MLINLYENNPGKINASGAHKIDPSIDITLLQWSLRNIAILIVTINIIVLVKVYIIFFLLIEVLLSINNESNTVYVGYIDNKYEEIKFSK